MYHIAAIGFTAAICSTFALLPQVIRVWKTRETDQLSGGAFLLMFVGAILWFTYGILREDMVIISANSITLLFIAYIIVIKAKNTYSSNQQE
ncbi:MAG: SemiSWEET transporter [Ignavibacteriae bacterium]|jgi:MtN3 and saliva related transmembrane protein|nr:SemiSWEET transporter [Ignavibacteriota bacterium]